MSLLPATYCNTVSCWAFRVNDVELLFIFHPWTLPLMLPPHPHNSHTEKLVSGRMRRIVALHPVMEWWTPPKKTHLVNAMGPLLVYHVTHSNVDVEGRGDRTHCVELHSSKQRSVRGANDPCEINESIKSKNPQSRRAWRDPLTLINRQMADNQLGGGSSGPAAPQPWEKVTSPFAPSTELNVRGQHYVAVAQLHCLYVNTRHEILNDCIDIFHLKPVWQTVWALLDYLKWVLSLLLAVARSRSIVMNSVGLVLFCFVQFHFELIKTSKWKICLARCPLCFLISWPQISHGTCSKAPVLHTRLQQRKRQNMQNKFALLFAVFHNSLSQPWRASGKEEGAGKRARKRRPDPAHTWML